MPEAHFRRTRIDVAHHTAAVARIRNENDLGAAQLELPDEMVEFTAKDALLRSRRRGRKPGQQEDVLLAVGLRALDALGLLRSVAGNRQEDDIVGPGTLDQPR